MKPTVNFMQSHETKHMIHDLVRSGLWGYGAQALRDMDFHIEKMSCERDAYVLYDVDYDSAIVVASEAALPSDYSTYDAMYYGLRVVLLEADDLVDLVADGFTLLGEELIGEVSEADV